MAAKPKAPKSPFMSAVPRPFSGRRNGFTGSISLLITGDEEGPAINATVKVLDWIKAEGGIPVHCPVAEFGPSSATGHKTDEAVAVADQEALTEIYLGVLEANFANPPCPA